MWLYELGYAIFIFLSSFMTYHGFVARVTLIVSHVDEDMHTYPVHLSSPQVLRGVRVARSLVFCVMFFGSLFVLFHLAMVLSVLRFMASGYFVGIFILFCMDKMIDIFNVHAINLITLSKPSTQILTRATNKIILL
jgi:hypothetical protein